MVAATLQLAPLQRLAYRLSLLVRARQPRRVGWLPNPLHPVPLAALCGCCRHSKSRGPALWGALPSRQVAVAEAAVLGRCSTAHLAAMQGPPPSRPSVVAEAVAVVATAVVLAAVQGEAG